MTSNQKPNNSPDWLETKSKIKRRWKAIPPEEIEMCKNNLPLLANLLRANYLFSPALAQQEYALFTSTLDYSTSSADGGH